MEPVVIAILVGICVYLAAVALIPKRFLAGSTQHTRLTLNRLKSEDTFQEEEENVSVLRSHTWSTDPLTRVFFSLPGAEKLKPKLLKAGLAKHVGAYFAFCLIVGFASLYLLSSFGFVGLFGAVILTFMFGRWVIRRQIAKRNDAFLNFFPEALDMIVRSVRSGYPLNAAVRMVADNMQPPVSTEFKQVADEIAYGSTLIESLQRLSERIDEPDVRFFVVVLTVQQDVGGNLSEVLNNLSSIIRKRKHLRMKIKALASEGRATAWVLGSMPVVEALLILLISPDHLTPLFTTPLGHTVLGVTIGVATLGVFLVRQLVNIKV